MLTQHPTLLIGPADWEGAHMPRPEFERRMEVLWSRDPQAGRAIVFGSSRHHAELAYFTNLTPKLEPAVALLSRTGPHRLFVGGGVNMIGAARPLTWIEQVLPMKDVTAALAAAGIDQRLLLVGADYMTVGFRRTVTEAIGASAVVDATAHVWSQMRRKSRCELDAIGAAVKATGAARKAMREAWMSGAGVTDVILAGERAAAAAGAQDVRTLFSPDGGRTLRPFFAPATRQVDPLLAYVAIRRFNYWAECFPLFTTRPEPTRLYEKASDAMASAACAIKTGVATHEIEQLIEAAIAPCRSHPITAQAFAQRMGLALDEPPHTNIGATFEEGEVYSLRIGVSDEPRASMICSRMFVVRSDGIVAFDEDEAP